MSENKPITICTRGSALALAQARRVLADAEHLFPGVPFELKIIRTTGDKLQTASLANDTGALPRGLFTKELEAALLAGEADIAVHSLKDLPTELPEGLQLAAVGPRADVREVLVYRDAAAVAASASPAAEWSPGQRARWGGRKNLRPADLPKGAVVGSSSTRRAAQLRALRSDLQIVPLRGNVGTRLQKLADDSGLDATLLAAAGLVRLGMFIGPKGELTLDPTLPPDHDCAPPPAGLMATVLDEDVLLPAVGQGAVALEARTDADESVAAVCAALSHHNTFQAVLAERAFLRAMGGGCQSPVAGFARVVGHQLWLRAASYEGGVARTAEGRRVVREAEQLGREVAQRLGGGDSN